MIFTNLIAAGETKSPRRLCRQFLGHRINLSCKRILRRDTMYWPIVLAILLSLLKISTNCNKLPHFLHPKRIHMREANGSPHREKGAYTMTTIFNVELEQAW